MDQSFFIQNRQRLSGVLGGGLVVVSGYSALQQRSDMAHLFLQEANFWYLTGVEEPDWQLIIDGGRQKSWLVAPERSEVSLIFDGELGNEKVAQQSGVDAVMNQVEADKLLKELAMHHKTVFSLGADPHEEYFSFVVNPAPSRLWQRLDEVFETVKSCRSELERLRAIKQPVEVERIKAAVSLTSNAFRAVKEQMADFRYEYQIEAEFSYIFRRAGAEGHAYQPIVAAGANANTLHYAKNQDSLPKTGMVLMDIGARLNGYPADITRTYAVEGGVTERQRQVHNEVRGVLQQTVDLLRPELDVKEYHQSVDGFMKQALMRLGLIESLDDQDGYRRYFPHAVSHGLGVDVHDPLGRPKAFEAGMVLTVEPGIYISEEGFGVRLEDNVLITESGHDNLSADLSLEL